MSYLEATKRKIVNKPWGREVIWAITDKYVGKILQILAGHSLSLQHHEIKDETIMILSGRMKLYVGQNPTEALQNPIIMEEGDCFHITPLTVHRMVAIEDCQVLETSTPELDDVVRHSDEYGRV